LTITVITFITKPDESLVYKHLSEFHKILLKDPFYLSICMLNPHPSYQLDPMHTSQHYLLIEIHYLFIENCKPAFYEFVC